MLRAPTSFFAVSLLALAGCGDPDAGKLFADVQYATRCPTTNHCTGPVDRDVCGIHQGTACSGTESMAVLSCTAAETSDGLNYLLNFSVSQGGDFSLSIRNAMVPVAGGFGGGAQCTVVASENPNTYEGRCGSAEPGVAQPCQLSAITFRDDMGNPTLEGLILCRDLPHVSSPTTLQTDITQAGTGGAALPGRFRIANCQGLTLE